MRREGRQLLRLVTVITSVVFAACAASPPPKPMTREEFLANRERMIDQAGRSPSLAGTPPPHTSTWNC